MKYINPVIKLKSECTCSYLVNVGDHTNQVILQTPKGMYENKTEVSVDRCIAPEITVLWFISKIFTYGSCCGHHNNNIKMANIDSKDVQKAINAGYEVREAMYE